jgi:hypothetical protein
MISFVISVLATVLVLGNATMLIAAATVPDAGSLQRETIRVFTPPPTAPKPLWPKPMREEDKGARVLSQEGVGTIPSAGMV